jgi:glycosyltransferase involved in cell wall biosynthesis
MTQVSLLMPCYNAAPYLERALDSVLSQSYSEIEVIAVNDGSTDATAEILKAYERFGVHVINQKNSGQSSAANTAFRQSTGELIKFFDADDVMDPDMVALQVDRLVGRTDAIAIGEWRRFYGAEPDSSHFPHLKMYRDALPVDWLTQEWATTRPMMQCALWLIPRPIIKVCGLWDERLSLINDFEYFARVLLGAQEILYTPGARLHYRSGLAGSLSGRKSRAAVESQLLSLVLGTRHLLAVSDTAETRSVCAGLLQSFDFEHFPKHPDLRAKVRARVAELGGSSLEPDGPPGFHALRRLIGWRAARRVQRIAESNGLNGAARHSLSRERHGA